MFSYHRLALSALGILSAAALSSTAFSAGPLVCEQFGDAKGRCVVQPTIVAGIQPYHSDFLVNYSFVCRGHPVHAALAIGIDSRPLPFTTGVVPVSLSGNGPLEIVDLDPARTARATLLGPCQIIIDSVSISPSLVQLGQWHSESIMQTKIITATLGSWKMSKRFDKVVTWNTEQLLSAKVSLESQLASLVAGVALKDLIYPLTHPDPELRGRLLPYEQMPQAWKDALLFNPQLPDIAGMLSQVQAILDGQLPVYNPDDTRRYREGLVGEVAAGITMVDRLGRWQSRLTLAMNQAKAGLKGACDLATTELNQ